MDDIFSRNERRERSSTFLFVAKTFVVSLRESRTLLLVDSDETSEGWELVGRENEDQSFAIIRIQSSRISSSFASLRSLPSNQLHTSYRNVSLTAI